MPWTGNIAKTMTSTSSREILRFSGNNIHCSPRDQWLSVYCLIRLQLLELIMRSVPKSHDTFSPRRTNQNEKWKNWFRGWCSPAANSVHLLKNLGSAPRKTRTLFGPVKPFVKLRPAYSVRLIFSYVLKGIKVKITAKSAALRRLRFEDTKKIMSPGLSPKRFGTFEKRGMVSANQHKYYRNVWCKP